ncbi:hypothetical protein BDZ91DRAFT_762671 [Kalaharituber pfeilii]|nr:hypothetical protein BDZ91DRAFT_762671 [Kalaharituber pfeilii]
MAEDASEVIAEIRAFDTGKGGTDTKATRDRNMLSLLLEPPGLPSEGQNTGTNANTSQNKQSPDICRGILWALNTKKCIRQVILRYFDDQTWDQSPCDRQCSNCTPEKIPFSIRALIPQDAIPSSVLEQANTIAPSLQQTRGDIIVTQVCIQNLKTRLRALRQHHWQLITNHSRHSVFGSEFIFNDTELKAIISKAASITTIYDLENLLKVPRPIPRTKHLQVLQDILIDVKDSIQTFCRKRPQQNNQTIAFLLADDPPSHTNMVPEMQELPPEPVQLSQSAREPLRDITGDTNFPPLAEQPSKPLPQQQPIEPSTLVQTTLPQPKKRDRPPGSKNKPKPPGYIPPTKRPRISK